MNKPHFSQVTGIWEHAQKYIPMAPCQHCFVNVPEESLDLHADSNMMLCEDCMKEFEIEDNLHERENNSLI